MPKYAYSQRYVNYPTLIGVHSQSHVRYDKFHSGNSPVEILKEEAIKTYESKYFCLQFYLNAN